MAKYPSTILPQTNDPKEIQRAILDLLDKINADAAGVSAFMKTLLDDADAETARATLGISEYGSNSNGYYVKLGDGTLIQWRQGSRTDWAINNAYGSLYQGTVSFTFPIAFYSVPTVIPGQAQWGAGASWQTLQGNPTTTAFSFRAIDVQSRAAGTAVIYSWFAIGRWK